MAPTKAGKKQPAEVNEAFFNAIINNDSLGISIIDHKGIIRFRNKLAEEFTGVKNSDTIGKHFSAISDEKIILEVNDMLKTGESILGLPLTTSKGTQAIVHRIPLFGTGRKVIGVMALMVFTDIADVQAILAKLKIMEDKVDYYESKIQQILGAKYTFDNIVGECSRTEYVIKIAKKYAKSDSNVLITGQSGTGKELFAHAIHLHSKRRLGPFIVINCPSIPEELLESELFGYEAGAFSGAKKKGKAGKIELANNGTIFLDEISSMSMKIQPKLLRVFQDKRIERLGGSKSIEVNFRVISATNENLRDLVAQNRFREDLYYRLSVLNIDLPSLKERKKDIPLFIEHFLNLFRKESGLNIQKVNHDVVEILTNWSWPGNIREFRNVLEVAATTTETDTIEKKHLPPYVTMGSEGSNKIPGFSRTNLLKKKKADAERELLEAALNQHNWNKSRAAVSLGISRPLLYSLIKKYGLKE